VVVLSPLQKRQVIWWNCARSLLLLIIRLLKLIALTPYESGRTVFNALSQPWTPKEAPEFKESDTIGDGLFS